MASMRKLIRKNRCEDTYGEVSTSTTTHICTVSFCSTYYLGKNEITKDEKCLFKHSAKNRHANEHMDNRTTVHKILC